MRQRANSTLLRHLIAPMSCAGIVSPWLCASFPAILLPGNGNGVAALSGSILAGITVGTLCFLIVRTIVNHQQRATERWQRTLLGLGEARGRQAILDEVRMVEHACLKAHVVATQRCMFQAQAAQESWETRQWLEQALVQIDRLLQVVVELHRAVGTSALPDDFERSVADTMASLAVAYPHCTATFEVCGPRPVTGHDETVQRATLLILYNALLNAYTHGSPSSVRVQVQYAPDALILVVSDNGVGGVGSIPSRGAYRAQGRGLRDCAEIATRCGGVLRLESPPTGGTTLTVTLPLTNHALRTHGGFHVPRQTATLVEPSNSLSPPSFPSPLPSPLPSPAAVGGRASVVPRS